MKKKLSFTALMLVCVFSAVCASSNWSDAHTYQLNSGDGWKTRAVNNEKMGNEKDDTNNSKYDVCTLSKTMWSSPKFRVVNSNNEPVSGEITTAKAKRCATGDDNTGIAGRVYYGSVKPAWNQSGSDRIKLQFRVY